MENNPHYDPANLIETLRRIMGVQHDSHLAMRLGVPPSQISKISRKLTPVSPSFLLNLHEETGLSFSVLRGLMGDFRTSTSPTAEHPAIPPKARLLEVKHVLETKHPRMLRRPRAVSGHGSRLGGAA
jgi:transcriptional regulator with XRE-family HTH domain